MRSRIGRVFFELRRRRVFRVGGGDLVAGWVVIQVAATVSPAIGAPGWSVSLVIGLVGVGFPQCGRTAELDPHDHWPPFFKGLALAHQGRFGEAVAQHRRALEYSGESIVMQAALGHTYAVVGDVPAARGIISQLSADAAPRHLSSYEFAVIHAALDERDDAFEWLDRAYADRSAWMAYLNVDPRMDPLRGDPRFATLVQTVRLAQAQACGALTATG